MKPSYVASMLRRAVAPLALLLLVTTSSSACQSSESSPRPQQYPPPQYGPGPYGPQGPYGYPQGPGTGPQAGPGAYPQQQPYPPQQQPPPYYPPQQQPYPPPTAPMPGQAPLLAPLVGQLAQQAEVRGVLGELIQQLNASNQQKVRGIPLVFDQDPDVNAYAGCDDNGAPFLAGTAGILDAVDGMAQTRATDEMFGTQTYEAYMNAVLPRLLQAKPASPALPPGIIPSQYLMNPQRLSRAREIFDDVIAFTFGHELAHHYLGHTGCANGQAMSSGPNPAVLGHLVTRILPGLNQFNEAAADNYGLIDVLDTGRARRPQYRWSEKGGILLFDFFSRLDRASGISVFNPIGFLRTHPNPQLRTPLVQATARTWYSQHPDVR
ncbi:hypothetical protein LVJ94_30180 [Pendulispora rubella]|uniref:Peptidase M48 domain-containing protein n=1 Tax=Pendulispora rubella TaxID=2741070 RepID=A0ABZ2KRN8_9BACT